MPKPYQQDLRDRVLAAYDRGKQTKEIAGTLGVSPAWARRVKQVRREEDRTTRLPMGGPLSPPPFRMPSSCSGVGQASR